MDMCARCEDGGVIMCCDGLCQRSFHPVCLGMDDKPDEDPWKCNRCSSQMQKVGNVNMCQVFYFRASFHLANQPLAKFEPDQSATAGRYE